MTADITIEATPGQVVAIERDGFLVVAGPRRVQLPDAGGQYPVGPPVPVPTSKPCPECGGKGKRKAVGRAFMYCPTCNGDGTVPIVVEVVVPERECPAGWAATAENNCNYTGGHYCVRPRGHRSNQHRCSCGVTTTRRNALPLADEEGPARTLLRGTAEAVPVVEGAHRMRYSDEPTRLIIWPEGITYDENEGGCVRRERNVTHHFADVPRPEVGDTCWVVKP